MRSVSSDTRPSQSATLLRKTTWGGGSGSCQTSASHCSLIRRRPTSGMTRVTKTFGLAGIGGLLGGVKGPKGILATGLDFQQLRQPGGDHLRPGDVMAGRRPGPHLLLGRAEEPRLQVVDALL